MGATSVLIAAAADEAMLSNRFREQPFMMIDVPIALSHIVLQAWTMGLATRIVCSDGRCSAPRQSQSTVRRTQPNAAQASGRSGARVTARCAAARASAKATSSDTVPERACWTKARASSAQTIA